MLAIEMLEGEMGVEKKGKKVVNIAILIGIIVIFLIYLMFRIHMGNSAEMPIRDEDLGYANYKQEMELKRMVDDTLSGYVYQNWVYPEYYNDQLSKLDILVVYEKEVPNELKESLKTTISENYLIDNDSVDIEYIGYDAFSSSLSK